MSFHALHATRRDFDFVSQMIRVEMKMWFENWSRSKRVVQCFNRFVKWFVMNVRSMMLIKLRVFQMMNSLDRVKVRLRFFIISKRSFVATCCVERDESLQKKWCRLKSLNNMWWFFEASIMIRSIFDNVNELSLNEYEIDERLYTLWMRITFVSSSSLWIVILSTLMFVVKYSISQLFEFIWSLT